MTRSELRWTARDAGVIAGASALALILGGYCFGREDHSTYLPMMWHFQNPSLFRGDLLIESARHLHTYFWRVMARLTMVFPTEPTFFVVHALTIVGSCIAAYGTSLTLFRSRAAAYLGLVLLLLPKGLFGLVEAGINSQPVLTQTNAALCLLGFAIWAFLADRYVAAFALVGVAFNLQGMTACFVLVMFAAYLGYALARGAAARGDGRRVSLSALAGGALAFALLAAPTLARVIAVESRTPPAAAEDVALWVKIMRLRMAHHVFPLSWPWDVWARGALALACFAAAFVRVRAADRPAEGEKPRGVHTKVAAFAGAVLALCVVGLVFSEWRPALKVMQFQLWRSTRFVMYLGLLYLAADCAAAPRGWKGAGSACGLAGMLLFPRGFVLTAPVLLLYLASRARRACWILAALALIWAAVVLWRHPAEIVSFALPCWILAVVLALCAAARPGSIHERATYRNVLLGFISLLAIARLSRNYARHGEFTLDPLPSQKAWREVQQWCRRHTPKETTFLVPIYWDSFRCFSRRPIVCDYKDAGPYMYDLAALKEWNRRMTDLGLWKYRDPEKAYKALSLSRLRAAARRWGAAYVVMETTDAMPPETPLFTASYVGWRQHVEVSVFAAEAKP